MLKSRRALDEFKVGCKDFLFIYHTNTSKWSKYINVYVQWVYTSLTLMQFLSYYTNVYFLSIRMHTHEKFTSLLLCVDKKI